MNRPIRIKLKKKLKKMSNSSDVKNLYDNFQKESNTSKKTDLATRLLELMNNPQKLDASILQNITEYLFGGKKAELRFLKFDSNHLFGESQKIPLKVEAMGISDALKTQTSILSNLLAKNLGGSGTSDQMLSGELKAVMSTLKNPKDFKSVNFDSLIGSDYAKSVFRTNVLLPIKGRLLGIPELTIYDNNRGMILHGPPGNGKTIFAQAVATELVKLYKDNGKSENDVRFFEMLPSDVLKSLVGESEKFVHNEFEVAQFWDVKSKGKSTKSKDKVELTDTEVDETSPTKQQTSSIKIPESTSHPVFSSTSLKAPGKDDVDEGENTEDSSDTSSQPEHVNEDDDDDGKDQKEFDNMKNNFENLKNDESAMKELKTGVAILLIDEVDSIAGSRETSDKGYEKTLVSQLLLELNDLTPPKGREVFTIANTNFPENLDPGFWRRFSHHVYIAPPTALERLQLFRSELYSWAEKDDLSAKKAAKMVILIDICSYFQKDHNKLQFIFNTALFSNADITTLAKAFTQFKLSNAVRHWWKDDGNGKYTITSDAITTEKKEKEKYIAYYDIKTPPALSTVLTKEPKIADRIFARRKSTIRIPNLISHEWYHMFSESFKDSFDKVVGQKYYDKIVELEKRSPTEAEISIVRLRNELKKLNQGTSLDKVKAIETTLQNVKNDISVIRTLIGDSLVESEGNKSTWGDIGRKTLEFFSLKPNKDDKLVELWTAVYKVFATPPSIDDDEEDTTSKKGKSPNPLQDFEFFIHGVEEPEAEPEPEPAFNQLIGEVQQ